MTLPVPRTVLLQAELPEYVAETVADFVAFLLRLLAALVVLAVGWALGIVGVAAAIAIGAGIAIGWGGHSYVAENIEKWMGSASSRSRSSSEISGGRWWLSVMCWASVVSFPT